MTVYHLELRQFPHVARVFNLERDALDTQFVRPWVSGEMVDYGDRRWPPERTKLTVLEGPQVRTDELGLGRGWGAATRVARDVTEAVIADATRGARSRPEIAALKTAVEEVATRPLALRDVVDLAAAGHPGWRASEQLSLAEQAVWELLHEGRLELLRDGDPVAAQGWQEALLSFPVWTGAPDCAVRALGGAD